MLAKSPQERLDAGEALAVLRSVAPRSGDPAPRPRLVPDPTALFRSPRTSSIRRPGRPTPDAEEWLDPSEVAGLCDAASLEVEENAPAEAVGRLAELAPRVRAEWGVRRPVVARVWRIAAEGLRLAGECGDAARLYDGPAGELEPGDGENAVAARAVAQLRAAECRLAFGEIDAALRVIEECLFSCRRTACATGGTDHRCVFRSDHRRRGALRRPGCRGLMSGDPGAPRRPSRVRPSACCQTVSPPPASRSLTSFTSPWPSP